MYRYKETLVDNSIFVDACCNLENKNESTIIQDISRLIVPSAELYSRVLGRASYAAKTVGRPAVVAVERTSTANGD
jgi:hypothetical protein